MPVSADELRQAMRQWTTGVTIVTSRAEGIQNGMTVNSFTSISLDPPLVAVTLANHTRTHALVARSGVFAVTILSQLQAELADRFAGRIPEDGDRFHGLATFLLSSGAPLLADGLAWLDCRVVATHPLAESTLFLGEVDASRVIPDGEPLVYHSRIYRRLA
ncbi:MAG TPA: flavin reductase family protein [Anaerolineaceae bacterium]|nr:flavin reductase family protein [Anaerolineaceae bacterium]